ncbi:MAG TPA: hypothetical protein VH475_07825, partial [Tepidisphaeraceae bacterium]
MSQILASKISSVRRKHFGVFTTTGIAAAVGLFVLLLAASMLLDFWLNLPFTARAALLAINLAAVGAILLYGIFGPLIYGPDDDRIALMVEDAEPAFRTRLIASIQLSRPNAVPAGASTSLTRAMIAQAESLAGPMDFARVIRTERLLRVVILSMLILIVAATAFAWGGEVSRDLLKRSLFLADIPVPRKTRVLSITDDLLVARGDDVEIVALADGATPPDDKRRLFIQTLPDNKQDASRRQDFVMEPVKADPARLEQMRQTLHASKRDAAQTQRVLDKLDAAPAYAAKIENVQESFEYRVQLNDGESVRKYAVKVLPRPAITRVEAKQIYPAYTGRGIELRAPGDLTLLQGSKLQLAISVNKPLKRPATPGEKLNFIHLIGSDKDVPLVVDPKNAQQLAGG